jgi:hypothetical protein
MPVQFDMTINLGHIITLVTVLISFITWGQNIRWSLVSIEKRVTGLEKNQEEQTKLIIANAVMNQNLMQMADKLATLERRMSEAEKLRRQSVSRT